LRLGIFRELAPNVPPAMDLGLAGEGIPGSIEDIATGLEQPMEEALLKSVILAGTSVAALATASAFAAPPDRPMFKAGVGLRPNVHIEHKKTPLPTWQFTYTYSGTNYSDQFVGTNPSGGASTTIPTYIIPVYLVLKAPGTVNTNPEATLSNGRTVVANTVDSPIFDSTTTYTQGKVDVGTTQYEDAVQRASLWGTVSSNTGYHVLLGAPTIEALQTIDVPKADGKTATDFGVKVANVDINWLDPKLQKLLKTLKIPVDSLPIFITTQTYLTSSGECCIGGYHNYNNTQAYSMFTYIQTSGTFSQDVSALSHEAAEWINDPEVDNNSPCGIYEVGDPLEGTTAYGTHPYTVNGFTYHLQDIVMPPYFGAPKTTSVNSWYTFQDYDFTEVCENGS
jgi:hypothetical protein